jgi:hypothetical protein
MICQTMSIYCQCTPFQKSIIHKIDNNQFENGDLLWIDRDGNKVIDHAGVYCRMGLFFTNMMKHAVVENDIKTIHRTGYLLDESLFRFLRLYCHLGIVLLSEEEYNVQTSYECYTMCKFYGMDEAGEIVRIAIQTKMDAPSSIYVLNQMAGTLDESSDLFAFVTSYFCLHAKECIKRLTTKLTEACIDLIFQLLEGDDVNIDETDVFEDLYSFSSRKSKNDVEASQYFFGLRRSRSHSEGYADHQPCKKIRTCEPDHFPWKCVRVVGLTFESIMDFRSRYPSAFEDSFYLEILEKVRKSTESAVRPRAHKYISNFPRDLEFPVIKDCPKIVVSLLEDEYSIAYAAIPIQRNGIVDIPSFACCKKGIVTIQCRFTSHISIKGYVDLGVSGRRVDQLNMEIKVINFKKDRTLKKSVLTNVDRHVEFVVDKIITVTTLYGNDGYLFEPDVFPEIREGKYFLLKITCR